ncbi:hypothetical protein [Streptomyces sp. CB01580]|uniref:hypothetical protein n=1 Tax=Streptomyces sp. CB01580 TaxID=1703933 RepID=UPI001300DBD8|nr:hypothetical protein [Streptomyces sp. CB01580]
MVARPGRRSAMSAAATGTARIGALPGVDTVETAPIIRTLKRTGTVARDQAPAGGAPRR